LTTAWLIVTVGEVLSARKVPLGPAAGAKFPARSDAVPAAMDIPKVPLPAILLIVTVRVRPVPETLTSPAAVPVAFRVMFAATRVLALKLASAYVTT